MLAKSAIAYFVIHCTDSYRDYTTFEQVNYWHKLRKWLSEKSKVSIAYHYFIDGKGKLYQGRRAYGSEIEQGAAQYGLNDCSLGICLALKKGEVPSEAQRRQLKTLLIKLLKEYPQVQIEYRDKKGNIMSGIIGHRDVAKIKHDSRMATECPTDILWNMLQEIKKELKKEGY